MSESGIIGNAAGLDATYPGFQEALDSRQHSGFESISDRGKIAGTLYQHILEFSPLVTASDGFNAKTCTLDTGISRLVDGKWVPTWIGTALLEYRFIDMTGKPGEYESKSYPLLTGADRAHWQAPSENVFDGWRAYYRGGMRLSEYYRQTVAIDPCVAWARTIDPDVALDHPPNDYARDVRPPVQPVYPGWPDPAR
ncbi:hypothetical protein [Nocardia sp. MW-W600-9]